jgi:hypothetical protein
MDKKLRQLHRQWVAGNTEVAQQLAHHAIASRLYRFLPVSDPGDIGWLDGELEMRNNYHFSQLIPNSGAAETVKGELLRAINRMIYRYYNDGDGIASNSGPAQAYSYLTEGSHPLAQQMQEIFRSHGTPGDTPLSDTQALNSGQVYVRQLVTAAELILDHIEQHPGNEPNTEDYLEFDPMFFECESCRVTYEDEESAEECCMHECWTCSSQHESYEEAEQCCEEEEEEEEDDEDY